MKKVLLLGIALSLLALLPVNIEAYQTSIDRAYSDNIRQSDGKITTSNTDPMVDIPADLADDLTSVNVEGFAPDGVQTTATDIWDRSDSTPTQQTWIAPTTAQTHDIVSTSASDSSAGVGARTIRIYGLIDWDTPEITEDIVMNGQTSVTTTQSYVIIHRMEVLTKGATNVNVGAISAEANTDTQITAVILAGEGETHMAIYGISSLDEAFITQYSGDVISASARIKYSLQVNPEPSSELTNYVTIRKRGVVSTGSSSRDWPFKPYIKVAGAAIVKVSGTSNAMDTDGGAGFDIIRRTDTSGFNVLITSHSTPSLDRRILTTSNGRILRTTH